MIKWGYVPWHKNIEWFFQEIHVRRSSGQTKRKRCFQEQTGFSLWLVELELDGRAVNYSIMLKHLANKCYV